MSKPVGDKIPTNADESQPAYLAQVLDLVEGSTNAEAYIAQLHDLVELEGGTNAEEGKPAYLAQVLDLVEGGTNAEKGSKPAYFKYMLLPEDVRVVCTEFLSVKEVCTMRPTSSEVRDLVDKALSLEREKVVFNFIEQNVDFIELLQNPETRTRLVENVCAACPRIGRLFEVTGDGQEEPTPMRFVPSWKDVAVELPCTLKLPCGFLFDLACAPHLKTIDLWATCLSRMWINPPNLKAALPSLERANLKLELVPMSQYFVDACLANVAVYLEGTPEVNLHVRAHNWSDELSDALHAWENLRSVRIECSRALRDLKAREAPYATFEALRDLPFKLRDEVRGVTVCVSSELEGAAPIGEKDADAWARFFRELMATYEARKVPQAWAGALTRTLDGNSATLEIKLDVKAL